MGIPGVPFEKSHSKDEIVTSLKKHDGKLSYVAKELGCCHTSLLDYLKRHPDVKLVREEAQKSYLNKRLDVCESVLDVLANKVHTDPAHALKVLCTPSTISAKTAVSLLRKCALPIPTIPISSTLTATPLTNRLQKNSCYRQWVRTFTHCIALQRYLIGESVIVNLQYQFHVVSLPRTRLYPIVMTD